MKLCEVRVVFCSCSNILTGKVFWEAVRKGSGHELDLERQVHAAHEVRESVEAVLVERQGARLVQHPREAQARLRRAVHFVKLALRGQRGVQLLQQRFIQLRLIQFFIKHQLLYTYFHTLFFQFIQAQINTISNKQDFSLLYNV